MNRRIKMIRAYFGWTMTEFGNHLGVSQGHISKWERGVVPLAKVHIHAIIGATGVSREWFETGRGTMFPEE